MKEIIIKKEKDKKNICLIEDGKIVEQYEEGAKTNRLEGNIYCGKVKDIILGMQSAFIDIGEDKNAFIHIKDIIDKIDNKTGNRDQNFSTYDIGKYIKRDMPILVQVKKDEEDKKGARVAKHINLTGRYTVFMPNVEFVTISEKIEDVKERNRLLKICDNIKEKLYNKYNLRFGIIIRTATVGKGEKEISEDIESLIILWKKILEQYESVVESEEYPQIIYQNNDIEIKFIIGIIDSGISNIITNDVDEYSQIKNLLEKLKKDKDIKLILDKDNLEIDNYEINKQLEKIKDRKVWLNCGGFISIDKTEALTAIDVNSGKYIGSKSNNKEKTIFKVNKEASIEIAKQLRIRNISGIIIIDYIDMEDNEDERLIEKILKEELKKDRSKTQVVGFTKLNLLEMTRKKI